MQVLQFIIHRLVLLLSCGVSLVKVNRITKVFHAQGERISKSRSWWSFFPIAIGNVCLRFRTPRLEVLTHKEWKRWEFDLDVEGRVETGTHQRELLFRPAPGVPLEQLLLAAEREGTFCHQRAIEYTNDAAVALAHFHQRTVLRDGEVCAISHGDASIANVMIDERCRTASWIDFDLRHDLDQPASIRQADDLRALIFTSAVWIPAEQVSHLLSTVGQSYREASQESGRQTWATFHQWCVSGNLKYDFFHHAQCRRGKISSVRAVCWQGVDRLLREALAFNE